MVSVGMSGNYYIQLAYALGADIFEHTRTLRARTSVYKHGVIIDMKESAVTFAHIYEVDLKV